MIARTLIVSAIIALPFSVQFVVASTCVEYRVMSEHDHVKPFRCFLDNLIADQMRRGLTTNNVLNINAMDELDPVHDRLARSHIDQGEADHDGDGGWEAAEYDRDNGKRYSYGPAWTQIGQALPKVEAPSIVPDEPQTQADHTIAYLHKREGSE